MIRIIKCNNNNNFSSAQVMPVQLLTKTFLFDYWFEV